MIVRTQLGMLRRQLLSCVFRRLIELRDIGPVVTFSFDDCPRTAITNGGAIVEQFKGRATFYVAMGLEGTRNRLGEQFHAADLRGLSDRGHEVATHTFSHLSARRASLDVFLKDVQHGEDALRECLGPSASTNFAYPYGEATVRAKMCLGPQLWSCRGTQGGLNGPFVDLNLLRANRLYGGTERSEAAKSLILENEVRRSWLIFYSHDVAETPSAFGCTPALLEEVASFASGRRARIATVAEVLVDLARMP
jgi:peptidoglycan/xylan/chitin deacetylase (PgdA/CDA1 family)